MESKRLGLYPRKRIDKGLADTGFIEGPTVKIEYRWANGDYDKWRCDCRHARRAEPLISGTATSVPDPSEHRSDGVPMPRVDVQAQRRGLGRPSHVISQLFTVH